MLAKVRRRAYALESLRAARGALVDALALRPSLVRREACLRAARGALGCAVADLLRSRSVRCAVGCRGWVASASFGAAWVCLACAEANGYAGDLVDADLTELPGVGRVLRASG